MELKKRNLRYYETVLETGVNVDSGAEMIVPDLYPDIDRIVDTTGQTCLKEKILREDRLELVGVVRAGVLYRPEGLQGLKKLDVVIPFNHVFDGHFADGSQAKGRVRLLSVDALAINPRKIQVSISLYVEACVMSPRDLDVCDDVTGKYEVLKKSYPAYMAIGVKDKSFSVSEEIEISANRPPVEDILKSDIVISGNDVKVIGSKVVYKGTAQVKLLYQGNERPAMVEQEMGFSQILEMDGLEEGADVEIDFQLSGLEIDVRASASGEARNISVTLHIEAQAVARIERRIEAVADVYSVEKKVVPDFLPATLTTLREKNTRRQGVRETLEVNEDVEQVVDTCVSLWPASVQEDGAVSCEAVIKVLYLTVDQEYGRCMRRVPVNFENPGEGGRVSAFLGGDIMAAPTSGGIEVRFSVDFELTVKSGARVMLLSGVREEDEPAAAERPSVVLRRGRDGETLWDIAKKYCSTRKDLAMVNGLEDIDCIPNGQLLLIPRKK